MSFDIPATPVEIVKVGHPALRSGTRSVPQELFGTAALHELIEVMRATLAGKGVGPAAPQIAVPKQRGVSVFPGFKADVCRYWAIEVEGFQPNGQRKTWSLKGWSARIFQHEIDHLDGRLITDCMLPRTVTSTEPHGTGASSDLHERLAVAIQPPKEK